MSQRITLDLPLQSDRDRGTILPDHLKLGPERTARGLEPIEGALEALLQARRQEIPEPFADNLAE